MAGRHVGGRDRHVEDVVAVHVLDRRRRTRPMPSTPRAPTTEISRSRSTNASSTASLPAERCPGAPRGSSPRSIAHLPLAVVAERGRLQHGGTADAADAPRRDRPRCGRGANGVTGRPWSREKRLLAEAVLRDVERAAVRAGRSPALRGGRGRGRDVLELERDHVHAAGELADPRRGRRTTRTISTSAIWPVGVSCSGASVWTR